MSEKGRISGNRVRRRGVVQVVGKSRAVGAAIVAAVVVLSGCGSSDGEDTTTAAATTSAAEQPGNPWDLPLEQRPALFDPCTEIPDEAVAEGFGGPVRRTNRYINNKPGELMSCGWETDDVEINILSTWKSRDDYVSDRIIDVEAHDIAGRPGMRGIDNTDTTERSCLQLFFTEQGTIWLKLNLLDLLREFKGERSADPCEALEHVVVPVMAHIPPGDFQ
ncbi:MAG: DUF3558 family protein [Actinomycetales bacterium]|nr:DUF3558 family protein [Actinomycetales bacterium]